MTMKVHELKTESVHYLDIKKGIKKFDLRKNDRDFRSGDILHLREIRDDGDWGGRGEAYPKGHSREGWMYTGADMLVRVTHRIGGGPGLDLDYCILSIERL